MANYNKGILGAFSGKVGNVVGASWRSISVMRSLPRKSKKHPTDLQMLQRTKVSVIVPFLAKGKEIIDQYYGQKHGFKSRMNLCTSYHLLNVMEEDAGEMTIKYPRVIWTKGELLGLGSVTVVMAANQEMDITFVGWSGQGNAEDEDEVMVMVYDKDLDQLLAVTQIATRLSGMATVSLPEYWSGHKVEIWISIASDPRKLVATSQYIGERIVT
jgi:hypothetical protein